MTELSLDKIKLMLGAHNDGVYRLEARANLGVIVGWLVEEVEALSPPEPTMSITEVMENYPYEEAAKIIHEAAKEVHGMLRPILCSYAVETAARETGKVIERAFPGTLSPVDMASFCITTYFAALPLELPKMLYRPEKKS